MKYFLSLLLGTILVSQTFAQDPKFEMGIQTGPNLTKIRYLNGGSDTFKPKAALSISMFLQYNINKSFAVRIDPGYENKGYYANYHITDPSGNVIRAAKAVGNFNYITIPVLFRASTGNKIKYFINAGPYIGFLLSQNTIYDSYSYGTTKSNGTKDYKTLDAGITSGLGVAFPIKDKCALSIEARNNLGLMNIGKSSNSNDKTLSFNLLIGFAYKFSSK